LTALKNITHNPNVILRRWRDLRFILVEIERGIELRLAQEQVLHARFVIERLVRLRLIVGEGFLQARAALLFLLRELVDGAQSRKRQAQAVQIENRSEWDMECWEL
jgi:hypothetical protein